MKTYSIKLHLKDLEVLQKHLKDKSLVGKIDSLSKTHGETNRQTIFDFNETEIDKILDCLTELLCQIGLTNNDEPNAFGYYLESLIDKFSIE